MVKSRVFNCFNFKGQKQECDFSNLEELECCTLNEFEISDEIIKELNKMKKIKMLVFNHCTFNNSQKIKIEIEKLVITYSKNFKIDYIENVNKLNNLIFTCLGRVDISEFSRMKNLEKLSIYECSIINFSYIKNLENIKELNLDGSNIDNEEIINSLKDTVNLRYNKNYHVC